LLAAREMEAAHMTALGAIARFVEHARAVGHAGPYALARVAPPPRDYLELPKLAPPPNDDAADARLG
jgi:hypothetical protein